MSTRAAPLVADHPAPDILRLRLERPEHHNPLDRAVVEALRDALADHGRAAAAVILCASGSFSAGADLALPDDERAAVSNLLYELYRQMVELPSPILAAARGHAIGGGAQLLVACDVRVAAPDLQIRFPGPGHGLVVGAWSLPSLVGRGRALDLCLTMRSVGAEEAHRIGLVDRITPDPDATALQLARAVAGLDRQAVARTKAVVAQAAGHASALPLEATGNQRWSGAIGPVPADPDHVDPERQPEVEGAGVPNTPKGRRTRAQILVAARRIFARDGYVKTRMSDIADEAGVSQGALYRYFTNKEDVFENLVGDTHERLYEASRSGGRHFGSDPYQALLQANEGYLREYYANRDIMRVLVEAAAVEPHFRDFWWRMRSRHIARFIASLGRLDHGLALHDGDVAVGADAMACMVEQTAYMWYAHAEFTRRDVPVEEAARVLTRAWWSLFFGTDRPESE